MYAADSGKCDVVTELISLGADVDIQNNVSHFLMPHHDAGKWFRPPPPPSKYLRKLFIQLLLQIDLGSPSVRMRSEGYGSCPFTVCVCVCVCARARCVCVRVC